jgi:CRISPR/Cas system CSM-associated protein Csm3 (group 7 of RAMP superfamily)
MTRLALLFYLRPISYFSFQVKLHFETEQTWEKETLVMTNTKQHALNKHQQDMNTFRSEARKKLARQRSVTVKLQNEKAHLEQENKEVIAQLEEELDILVHKTENEIQRTSAEEREISEQLMLEAGILKRRLSHTRKTINDAKDRVTVMLDRTAGAQTKVSDE